MLILISKGLHLSLAGAYKSILQNDKAVFEILLVSKINWKLNSFTEVRPSHGCRLNRVRISACSKIQMLNVRWISRRSWTDEKVGNVPFWPLVGAQVSDAGCLSRAAVYPNPSQDEVYFLRCGKEACAHTLSTVARYGRVTPCVWKQERGGNPPPCFFFT